VLAAHLVAASPQAPGTSFFPLHTVWTLALNNALTTPPVFHDGRGYFCISGDRVVAYDLASGSQLWIASAQVRSRPAAGGGLLFLVEPDAITALHDSDGTVAWRLPFTEGVAVPLVWDNGWLVVASTSGAVLALRASDAHLVWRRDIGTQVHGPPALAADRVYVPADDGRLLAFRIDTGAPVWERRLGGPASDILALDDRLYVGSTDNYLYSVDAAKGEVTWRWLTGADVIGHPALDAKHVYFVSLDNLLRALDRKSGSQVWKRALPMRPTAGPLLAGGSLLVPGLETSLRVYAAKDGAPGTDIAAGGIIAAPPEIITEPNMPAPTLVYVTSDLASGATVTAMSHSIDPPILPAVAPLPNVVKP